MSHYGSGPEAEHGENLAPRMVAACAPTCAHVAAYRGLPRDRRHDRPPHRPAAERAAHHHRTYFGQGAHQGAYLYSNGWAAGARRLELWQPHSATVVSQPGGAPRGDGA